jgi:hypothetical protein
MPEHSGHTLFTEALRVVNRALGAHEGEAPWRGLLRRAGERLEGVDFGVEVYEGDTPTPVDCYTIRLHDGKFAVSSHGEAPTPVDWKVSVDELRWIAENPEACIEAPERLGMEWLRRRVGER